MVKIEGRAIKIPSFSYPGGKHYQRRWLASFFPADIPGRFADVFAGRGNVFFHAASTLTARSWQVNDLRTWKFFDLIRRSTEADIRSLVGDTYPGSEEYAECVKDYDADRSILLEPLITFSGGGWGQGYRHGPKAPTVEGYVSRLLVARRILQELDVEVTGVDYMEVLGKLGDSDFAYLDPPYMGCDVRSYYSGDVRHEEMAMALRGASYGWSLSEYDRPLYRDILGPPVDMREYALKVSGKIVAAEQRVECIWTSKGAEQ